MSVNGADKMSVTQRIAALDRDARAAADAIMARIRSGTMTAEQRQRLVARIVATLGTFENEDYNGSARGATKIGEGGVVA